MAHPDYDDLLNALIPFAQDMLKKHGEFFPFGASVNSEGEIELAQADAGSEQPESQELIEMLQQGFGEEANRGAIRASAICMDVRIVPPGETEKSDAISLHLEHRDDEPSAVYLPYRKGMLGKYKYGELFATEGERKVFEAKKKR